MNNSVFLSNIDFRPDVDGLMRRLRLKAGSADAAEFIAMLDEAEEIAQPAAVYRKSRVERREEAIVTIEGVRFQSRVLRVNLDKAPVVYPFLASCGVALQGWGETQTDMIRRYWAEMIKEEALRMSLSALFQEIDLREGPGHFSTMSPGSLESWPISQQAPLFDLLGNEARNVGVTLTDSMLMVPTKSVSGMIFPTDASFESCMLCRREDCPNRRAPYDESLYEREFCPAVH